MAKLKRELGCHSGKTQPEYVFCVSLSKGDQILLNETEAGSYWGPSVLLTAGGCQALWSLTQRASCWAGGLDPLERGDPLTVERTTDQLLETVHKAACLQVKYNCKLLPFQELPILLSQSVDAERMTSLIWELPEPLKLMAIQLQGKLQASVPLKRVIAALRGTTSSPPEDALAWEGSCGLEETFLRN